MLINLSDIIKDYGGRLELSESFTMPPNGINFTTINTIVSKRAIIMSTKVKWSLIVNFSTDDFF